MTYQKYQKKYIQFFFAGDTSVFLEGDNLNTLSTVINKELNNTINLACIQ